MSAQQTEGVALYIEDAPPYAKGWSQDKKTVLLGPKAQTARSKWIEDGVALGLDQETLEIVWQQGMDLV